MPTRLTYLPDERAAALRPELLSALHDAAGEACGEAFADFFDSSMRGLLVNGFDRVGAHEGTVWLLDAERTALIPRFNSGPQAAEFVGVFRQPLSKGMVATVAATEQPICENQVCNDSRQDGRLDATLGVKTATMLAVPFTFLGELRGVISCVRLMPKEPAAPAPSGFTAGDLQALQFTARIVSRLIEYRLLARTLGLEELG